MTRERLRNRRRNETVDLDVGGTRYTLCIGYYADGRPGEIFASGAKIGSAMDAIVADAAVLVSLLLQHGIEPRSIQHSLGRHSDGDAASIIGAVVDELLRLEVAAA
jgi:hypothetical protein